MGRLTPKALTTLPQGYTAGSHAAGIKKTGSLDVGVVLSDRPARAAGLFTTNRVKAAPVLLSQKHLAQQDKAMRAIILNSGNANAVTGEEGHRNAASAASKTAQCCGVSADQVIVLSTGVIGVPLPMDRLLSGLQQACFNRNKSGGAGLAEAMMTTDTLPKFACFTGKGFTIQGFAKGSGMIHPNMATMLAIILTDADIPQEQLDQALRLANAQSFNRISVDGDTSTNDSVIALANGAAGVSPDQAVFLAGLTQVCIDLAKAIVRDGEGADKLIEIHVRGAESESEAELAAKGIATSLLFKTAMFGCDANWGRVLSALGQSGAHFEEDSVHLAFGPVSVLAAGEPLAFDEVAAKEYLSGSEVLVQLNLGVGQGQARVWTCDLSHEYVTINGSYRS